MRKHHPHLEGRSKNSSDELSRLNVCFIEQLLTEAIQQFDHTEDFAAHKNRNHQNVVSLETHGVGDAIQENTGINYW